MSQLKSVDIIAAKSSLETSVDTWETVAHGFTLLVAVGLIIEYREPFVSFWRTFDWSYITASIGGVLVTVGVAGELITGLRSTTKDGELREANSLLSRRATEELTASNERIASLNLLAEQERHARVKLQSQMAGRCISAKQTALLRERLWAYRGTMLVIIQGVETVEAHRLTDVLDSVMGARVCQWDAFINRDKPVGILPVEGIHVLWTPQQRSMEAARALVFALNEIGIKASSVDGVTHADGIDRSSAFLQRLWPLSTWHPEKEAVLLIVNDKPMPDMPEL